jgi:uncharacterized protein (TIGR00106 family)
MIVEFNVCPTDETHFSKDVARIIKILEEEGVPYRLGPMGTALEGDWQTVMAAIQRCHDAMIAKHGRVITTITIDERKAHPHHLDEMVSSVEKRLGHKLVSSPKPEPSATLDF